MLDNNTFEWPEITVDTPVSEVKRIHQLIWDDVIENGDKPETPYFNDCAACEYAMLKDGIVEISQFFKGCTRCPIKWPKNETCVKPDSLFRNWYNTRKPEIARQIRDIPFKEDRIMDDVTLNDIMSVIKSLVNDEKVSDNAFRLLVRHCCNGLIDQRLVIVF